jgi:hypothetical protein
LGWVLSGHKNIVHVTLTEGIQWKGIWIQVRLSPGNMG